MPALWDAQTNVKFLLNIAEQTGAKPNWESIAKAMDNVFSSEACRYVLTVFILQDAIASRCWRSSMQNYSVLATPVNIPYEPC